MQQLKLMAVLATAFLALAACQQQGPFEEAGENIDQAVEDTGNAIEDACEDLKDNLDAEDKDC